MKVTIIVTADGTARTTTVDVEAASPQEAAVETLGMITDTLAPPVPADVAQTAMDAMSGVFDTLATLRRVLEAVHAHDMTLNDPNGDGSGDSAQAPTGDDYNEVTGLLQPLYDALRMVGPCSPWEARHPTK